MLMRAATVVQVLQDFGAPPTIAPRPTTTVANPHTDRSLGSKETHIQSHNRRGRVAVARCGPGRALHGGRDAVDGSTPLRHRQRAAHHAISAGINSASVSPGRRVRAARYLSAAKHANERRRRQCRNYAGY